MANDRNLKPFDERTEDEQRAIQRKGGIASGQARREKKELRHMLEMLLDKEYTDKKTGKTATGREAITTALIGQAMKGNVKAFETIRDSIGEKPVEKVMIADVDQSVIDEVERMVQGDK